MAEGWEEEGCGLDAQGLPHQVEEEGLLDVQAGRSRVSCAMNAFEFSLDPKNLITLMQKDGKFQWRSGGGIEMSPVFDDKESAESYRVGKGLLTPTERKDSGFDV